jgi:hypothetical protein
VQQTGCGELRLLSCTRAADTQARRYAAAAIRSSADRLRLVGS